MNLLEWTILVKIRKVSAQTMMTTTTIKSLTLGEAWLVTQRGQELQTKAQEAKNQVILWKGHFKEAMQKVVIIKKNQIKRSEEEVNRPKGVVRNLVSARYSD